MLEEYRKLRDASEPTVSSQLELTKYCSRHGLKEQAVAHWSAIIELDPDHSEARKQLGYELADGRWLSKREFEADRKKSVHVAESLRKNAAEIKKIAEELRTGKLTQSVAVDRILAEQDVSSIPIWELFLSSAHDQGAAVVVAALAKDSSPEATLSLARHATWANASIVRGNAIESLQNRDKHAYIPPMLAELHGPWLASRELQLNQSNRLVNRYTLVAEGPDKQLLRVLDDTYFLRGDPWVAANMANSSAATSNQRNEVLRRNLNIRVQFVNSQIMSTLSAITGETEPKTPQDWWEWWDDSNEVYSATEKPILASYAYRNAEVVGAPLLSNSGSDINLPRRSTGQRKECLAGGTPIMTQRGPIVIERIRIGDLALSQHPVTGEVRLQPVLQTTVREPEQLIRITLESGSSTSPRVIRASGGHPFWVSGKGWVRARMLEEGMRLHGLENFTTIQKVELEEKMTKTYNLVVHDFHSYFVGPEAILSHDNSIIAPIRCKVPGLEE